MIIQNFSININFLCHPMYSLYNKTNENIYQIFDENELIFERRTTDGNEPIYSDFPVLGYILGKAQKLRQRKIDLHIKDVCASLSIGYSGESLERIKKAIEKWLSTEIFIKNFFVGKNKAQKYAQIKTNIFDSVKIEKAIVKIEINEDFYNYNLSDYVKVIDLDMYKEKSAMTCRLFEIISPKIWLNNSHPLWFITVKNFGMRLGLRMKKQSEIFRAFHKSKVVNGKVIPSAIEEFINMGNFSYSISGTRKNKLIIFGGTDNPLEFAQLISKDLRLKKICQEIPYVGKPEKTMPKKLEDVVTYKTIDPSLSKALDFIAKNPKLESVNPRLIDPVILEKNIDSVCLAYEKQKGKIKNHGAWFTSGLVQGRENFVEIKQPVKPSKKEEDMRNEETKLFLECLHKMNHKELEDIFYSLPENMSIYSRLQEMFFLLCSDFSRNMALIDGEAWCHHSFYQAIVKEDLEGTLKKVGQLPPTKETFHLGSTLKRAPMPELKPLERKKRDRGFKNLHLKDK